MEKEVKKKKIVAINEPMMSQGEVPLHDATASILSPI